jgi:hypothetical protein
VSRLPDPEDLSPDDRRREVASIFARAAIRLAERWALNSSATQKLSNSRTNEVAVSPEVGLTVHDG